MKLGIRLIRELILSVGFQFEIKQLRKSRLSCKEGNRFYNINLYIYLRNKYIHVKCNVKQEVGLDNLD